MTPADPPTQLQVHNLSKDFGRLRALDRVSFEIRRGEVVGLIGPNGAGKTTLLECMAGLQLRDSGSITSVAHGTIHYLPDGIAPWETQSVEWILQFIAVLHDTAHPAVDEVIAELSLDTLRRQPMGTLSRGQRKRALIALSLVTAAPILLLDEPFDGLDLRQVREVAAVLRRHADQGRTLLLSIHQLADAARVCDRLILLSNGVIVGNGTLAELRSTTAMPDASLEEIFLALT